jgi:hypothetical protein
MDIDATGRFSIPFGLTPLRPGPLLLCGYTAGLAGETLASASLTLPVRATAPSRPQNLTLPRVRRTGGRAVCDPGRWSNRPTRFSYSWLLDGHGRRGAASRTLVLTRKLHGHGIQCRVTAWSSAGHGTALSPRLVIH